MYSSYSTINLNKFPGEMKVPGKTLMQQIQNTGYQDLYRNLQEMRREEFAKEVKDGQFTSEFGGFGQAATSSVKYIGLLVVFFAIGFVATKFWYKKTII